MAIDPQRIGHGAMGLMEDLAMRYGEGAELAGLVLVADVRPDADDPRRGEVVYLPVEGGLEEALRILNLATAACAADVEVEREEGGGRG